MRGLRPNRLLIRALFFAIEAGAGILRCADAHPRLQFERFASIREAGATRMPEKADSEVTLFYDLAAKPKVSVAYEP